jgi:hypothetical protein
MANWRKELRDLTRRLPEADIETSATAAAIHSAESDRGCALIAGSVAENALETIIRTRMTPLNKEREDQIFGIDGILGSFSSKIKIAFAFGFIDVDLRDQLDRMREIRNVFAHSKIAIDFKTPEIHRACVGLLKSTDQSEINPRAVYSNTSYLLLQAATFALVQKAMDGNNKPISYNEALSFFGKSMIPLLLQIPVNPPEENKPITPPAPPESSPA